MTVLLSYSSQEERMTRARDSIRNRQVNNHTRPYKPLTIRGVSLTVALSHHRQDSSKPTGKMTSGHASAQWRSETDQPAAMYATQPAVCIYTTVPFIVSLSTAVLSHRQGASARTSCTRRSETRTFCTSDSRPHQSCRTRCSQG